MSTYCVHESSRLAWRFNRLNAGHSRMQQSATLWDRSRLARGLTFGQVALAPGFRQLAGEGRIITDTETCTRCTPVM